MISQTVSAIDRFKNESFGIYALYFSYPNLLKLFIFKIGRDNYKKVHFKPVFFTDIFLTNCRNSAISVKQRHINFLKGSITAYKLV